MDTNPAPALRPFLGGLLAMPLLLLGALPAGAQPTGGPYGPVPQTYSVPANAAHIYYVAPDGRADVAGTNRAPSVPDRSVGQAHTKPRSMSPLCTRFPVAESARLVDVIVRAVRMKYAPSTIMHATMISPYALAMLPPIAVGPLRSATAYYESQSA